MPQGWKTTTLCEVLAPKGYIRGPFGSALRRNELLDAGIPVYEQQHAIYDVRGFRFFISKNKFQEMKRFETKMNDLIISCSGTLGKVSIIRESDPKGIISQALLLLRANKDIILPQYLQYFFSSKEGYNAIVSRSSGSVQVNISKRADIEQIPLALPPLNEQKAIVETLGALDDKITNNTKINHHLTETTSATDNSPDIKRGNSVSRRAARRADSTLFACICKNIGLMLSSKLARISSLGSKISKALRTTVVMLGTAEPTFIPVKSRPRMMKYTNFATLGRVICV
ncbi:MAG: restriction endonuclease subunit S [Synergistaceae bacterium]|nr:restriction endonuclease subunit S [Synergistaceae bacterium]